MSAINTGTRLEQLLTLRRRLDHEIAIEQRRHATDGGRTDNTTKKPRRRNQPQGPNSVDELLATLGVDTKTVRTWANTTGYPTGSRGRISYDLVTAYAQAHQDTP